MAKTDGIELWELIFRKDHPEAHARQVLLDIQVSADGKTPGSHF
jgi:hypothetical protein